MPRRWCVALILAAAMVSTSNVAPAAAAAAAAPLLPDLGMARLSSLSASTVEGRRLLRFSTVIVNVGAGPFELTAERKPNSYFTAVQRVTGSDGSTSEVAVPTRFVFAGDGHQHWHVKDLETYRLERLDNGAHRGTGAKSGFCFFDNITYRLTLPNAPQAPQFGEKGCGKQSSTKLSMGLSIGWGDLYPSTLPDQFIDITDLASGRYRLRATADALGMFTESNQTNNETWVDFVLVNRQNESTVTVLEYGPAA